MLYKKYHRNFVRQFKGGVRYKCFSGGKRYIVAKEPYYRGEEIRIIDSECSVWVLISMDGTINCKIKVLNAV